jgi:S-DNA-T family DNA segregation ATPase FtsK/SpoIIIE
MDRLEDIIHLLIGGSTGTFQSMAVNGLLASLLVNHSSDRLRLLMAASSQAAFRPYDGIPHLLDSTAVDGRRTAEMLEWSALETVRRLEIVRACGRRSFERCNEYLLGQDRAPMPRLAVVVVGANRLLNGEKAGETLGHMERICSLGRSAGVHLVVTTERVRELPRRMVCLFPARMAYRVCSEAESRLLVDRAGAETLDKREEFLYKRIGRAGVEWLRGVKVSTGNLEQWALSWRQKGKFGEGQPHVSPVVSTSAARMTRGSRWKP